MNLYQKGEIGGSNSEWILTQLRLLLVFLALLLYTSGNMLLDIPSYSAVLLLVLALLYIVTLFVVLPRFYRPRWQHQWSITLTLIDALFVSFAVVVTGGPASPVVIFYLPLIFGATLRFSRNDANRVAAIMALSYVLVALFHPVDRYGNSASLLGYVMAHVILFGAVALLGGYVIQEVHSERRQREIVQQRYQDALQLQQVTQRLHSSLNLNIIAENIIRQVFNLLPNVRCAVTLMSNGEKFYGLEPDQIEKMNAWEASVGLGKQVWRSGVMAEVIGLNELPGDLPKQETDDLAMALGIENLLILPLCSNAICEGLVYIGSKEYTFTPADRILMRTIAIEAGAAIANARRYQAERDTVTKLQHLTKLKSEFLAMIGHELRTPLTSIKGFAQLLRRQATPEPEQVQRATGIIIQQSERLIDMIGIILNITKLESGLLELQRQPLRLGLLVEQTVGTIMSAQGRRYILEVPHDLPLVRGDPMRTERAVVHLLDNALKFSPADSPVYIRLHAEPDGVVMEMHDQGAGLSPEEMASLFGSYDASEACFHQKGMGIYEARNCIEAQGGRVWAESQPGKGSIFYIKLGF